MSIFKNFIVNVRRDGSATHSHNRNRLSVLYFFARCLLDLTEMRIARYISVTVIDLDDISETGRHSLFFTSVTHRRRPLTRPSTYAGKVDAVVVTLGLVPRVDACAEARYEHLHVGVGYWHCSGEIPELFQVVPCDACVARIVIVADGSSQQRGFIFGGEFINGLIELPFVAEKDIIRAEPAIGFFGRRIEECFMKIIFFIQKSREVAFRGF